MGWVVGVSWCRATLACASPFRAALWSWSSTFTPVLWMFLKHYLCFFSPEYPRGWEGWVGSLQEQGFGRVGGVLGACWRQSMPGCGRGTASSAQSLFHPSSLCPEKVFGSSRRNGRKDQQWCGWRWILWSLMDMGSSKVPPLELREAGAWGCCWERHGQMGLGRQSSSPWVDWRCLRLRLCDWTWRWMRNVKMGGLGVSKGKCEWVGNETGKWEEVGGGECTGREVAKSWSSVMGWLCEDTWKTGNNHPPGDRQRGWRAATGAVGCAGQHTDPAGLWCFPWHVIYSAWTLLCLGIKQ